MMIWLPDRDFSKIVFVGYIHISVQLSLFCEVFVFELFEDNLLNFVDAISQEPK